MDYFNRIHDYDIREEIGVGTFACVYKAVHKPSGQIVALKEINKDFFETPEKLNKTKREIDIAMKVDHPLIVHMYEHFENEQFIYLVMEYVEGSNMLDVINKYNVLPEGKARKYFQQIIRAIDYLHNTLNIVHRDLKAENILLDQNDNIKLIDFGLSRFCDENGCSTVCGSPAYTAPEIVKRMEYSHQADIWSAGILLFAMTAGYLPFYDENLPTQLHKIILINPVYPETISHELKCLLQKLLQKNPTERITIPEIYENPWFIFYEKHVNYADAAYCVNSLPLNMITLNQVRTYYPKLDVENLVKALDMSLSTPELAYYKIARLHAIQEIMNHKINHNSSQTSIIPYNSLGNISNATKVFKNKLSMFRRADITKSIPFGLIIEKPMQKNVVNTFFKVINSHKRKITISNIRGEIVVLQVIPKVDIF
ncbi:CAMK family protein kinase [Tritrichomonas foetus]|uniref:non-specific serine/threonine protein kinase n=1 Tax=Tritrichomonas foetus TaxID=1144522 RepID=A0A1J4K6Z1_9EUKA|nr:CAMK family protein kinase [Tritrichomonas foetus]|eukprot:OHT06746.1 CAMK family protein kinase [Tritrichomonas foetus]